MFLVDLEQGRIIADDELKQQIATAAALRRVAARATSSRWSDLPDRRRRRTSRTTRPCCSGSARSATPRKTCKILHGADGRATATRPSARWATTPPWPCSRTGRSCFTTTSSSSSRRSRTRRWTASAKKSSCRWRRPSAREYNLLEPTPRSARQIKLKSPILKNDELDKLRQLDGNGPQRLQVDDAADPLSRSRKARRAWSGRWTSCAARPATPSPTGYDFIILSDRGVDRDCAPIPALLAVAGVHHHLIREGTRTKVGLVLESGEPREVHHFALLIGYGAGAINPYLAFETLDDMIRQGDAAEHRSRQGGQELRQGGRQGRHEGDVQDGHLDGPELLRRPDLRGDRPEPGRDRQVLHLDGVAHRRRRPRRDRRGGRRPGTTTPSPSGRSTATPSTSAASTSTAARASTTCSTPRRSTSSSTPAAPATTRSFKEYSELVNDQARAALHAARPVRVQARRARRSRSRRSSRSSRS